MDAKQKEKVHQYFLEMVDYLDGRGLVVTDDDLIKEALHDFGNFSRLQRIMLHSMDADDMLK